ncbi:LLM class F420-dependent oxidoreductase [Parahaliea mediterranea]|uniref:LLM class F420-dependent oxidoreductase n=1 Tax=Parahaliea mediterranea TaxID=651086 RepID=A0A939DHM9_9GAMM|nr:LLM class F420-dependent oxidoreductase [Parahaliea mediterranea]
MKFVLSTSFSTVAHLTAIAPVADSHGWHAMSFSDHVVNPEQISNPYPYTDDGSRRWQPFTDWPDPWVTIGALAAITERLRFTNNIFVLPMRNPFLVAKAISTAAIISNNRVTPAFGVGWSQDEFALLQQDFRSRGKRTDEMLEIMRLLWSGEMVEYHGEHYDFDRLEMNPAPSERIPFWIGGISRPAMRRAARLADGWVTDLQSSSEIVDCIGQIRDWRREYGREREAFEVMATPSDAWDIDGYRRLEEAGVTHILTMPWALYHGETEDLQLKCDGVRRFADEVIAGFE